MDDRFNLKRFLDAQDPKYDTIVAELRAGLKSGHWMWYVFPQMKGLGSSWNSDYYGISSRDEAHAYLEHPALGARLIDCTNLVIAVPYRSAEEIFGDIDSKKFQSSMTLFAQIKTAQNVFRQGLEKYFSGRPDPVTVQMLSGDKGRNAST